LHQTNKGSTTVVGYKNISLLIAWLRTNFYLNWVTCMISLLNWINSILLCKVRVKIYLTHQVKLWCTFKSYRCGSEI